MSVIDTFNEFFEEFKQTDIWAAMSLAENSIYHREASIQVHTQMILDFYMANYYNDRTDRQRTTTLLSILFHDTGKPKAATPKFKEERGGHYLSFGGHEHISSRTFEDYVARNWPKLRDHFGLVPEDIYRIAWIIDNHLPHDLESPTVVARLADHFAHHSWWFEEDYRQCYFDQCISDQSGRISDNHEINVQVVKDWIVEVTDAAPIAKYSATYIDQHEHNLDKASQMVILIGASGSGKSTYRQTLVDQGYEVISPDEWKVTYYVQKHPDASYLFSPIELYQLAHDYCGTEESQFDSFFQTTLHGLIRSGKDLVVDTVGATKKTRKIFVSNGKRAGYAITCVLFPIDKETLFARSITREDKRVDASIILKQYEKITMPWMNFEADYLDIVTSNL